MNRILLLAAAGAMLLAQDGLQVPPTLERAQYLEQTVGDLDGAIVVYRQLANAAGAKREAIAEANYRLALALLKSGNLAEFNRQNAVLSEKFADFPDYVKDAREKYLAERRKPIGEFAGTHYRHF